MVKLLFPDAPVTILAFYLFVISWVLEEERTSRFKNLFFLKFILHNWKQKVIRLIKEPEIMCVLPYTRYHHHHCRRLLLHHHIPLDVNVSCCLSFDWCVEQYAIGFRSKYMLALLISYNLISIIFDCYCFAFGSCCFVELSSVCPNSLSLHFYNLTLLHLKLQHC